MGCGVVWCGEGGGWVWCKDATNIREDSGILPSFLPPSAHSIPSPVRPSTSLSILTATTVYIYTIVTIPIPLPLSLSHLFLVLISSIAATLPSLFLPCFLPLPFPFSSIYFQASHFLSFPLPVSCIFTQLSLSCP